MSDPDGGVLADENFLYGLVDRRNELPIKSAVRGDRLWKRRQACLHVDGAINGTVCYRLANKRVVTRKDGISGRANENHSVGTAARRLERVGHKRDMGAIG